ncbi:MAG TPA: type II secretion system minor pseudopilin GspK [Burkholderiales bacterium]|nr:type II secretion system minor pseudopilin GspK [Burkholderiales bacterium]
MNGARAQRGIAVVVAVLVVALATSTAAYILWHQSLWLRQVENITARAQADALARAAAAWAAAILAEDDPAIDHLAEAWARRMPPFPAENAELSGAIADEQAKFNVNNLAGEGGANVRDLVAFQRLLAAVGLPAALADGVVDWLDADNGVTPPNGAEDQYYLALDPPYRAANRRIADVAELARVKGFDAGALARLEPFVTALPAETAVNVNTASPTVLRALLPGLGPEDVARIIERRSQRPFASRDEFVRALPARSAASAGQIDAQIDVRSRFFRADATVRLGRVTTGYRALFERAERDEHGTPALVALTLVAI